MRRWQPGIKGSLAIFFLLAGLWLAVVAVLKALDSGEACSTAAFIVMLALPPILLGVFVGTWLTIIVPPLAYLLSWVIGQIINGFAGLDSDLNVLETALLIVFICLAMMLVFILGRGLGNLVGLGKKGAL